MSINLLRFNQAPKIPRTLEEIINLINKNPKKLLENCKNEVYNKYSFESNKFLSADGKIARNWAKIKFFAE